MEEENSVEVDETTEDSQPEANEEAESTSEDEDASEDITSEETEKPVEKPKTSRANERIRELVSQKKALESQLKEKAQLEGVSDDGIDPAKFGQSIMTNASNEARQAAQFEIEKLEAIKKYSFLENSQPAQLQVSRLINDGFSPLQAAELVSIEREQMMQEASENQKARAQAEVKLKKESQVDKAGRSAKSEGVFTMKQIEKMDVTTYRENIDEINRQLEAGLIK